MRISLLVLLVVLWLSTASGQTNQLKIHLKSGGTISYLISEVSKITFDSLLTSNENFKLKAEIVKKFQLAQNFPNPFNPTTTISFSIPSSGLVKIEIFNIRGQHVNTLLQNNLKPGNHNIAWSGKDFRNNPVSTGYYIYRLLFDGKQISKKMLFIK